MLKEQVRAMSLVVSRLFHNTWVKNGFSEGWSSFNTGAKSPFLGEEKVSIKGGKSN